MARKIASIFQSELDIGQFAPSNEVFWQDEEDGQREQTPEQLQKLEQAQKLEAHRLACELRQLAKFKSQMSIYAWDELWQKIERARGQRAKMVLFAQFLSFEANLKES